MKNHLIYTLYYDTIDYPGKYVVRRWVVDGIHPDPVLDVRLLVVSPNKETVEEIIPKGLHWMPRDSKDDPKILGSYI